ncbi:MAG: ABC transporter permease [Rickettsiales bacterium]|nr:ABC transporter permease [Rickettsiales bacterium]
MSLFSIALCYLRSRLSLSVLHITMMALGVGLMSLLILFNHHMQDRFFKESKGIDAVVGAKGSPLQLVLSTVQHMDIPTGNISLKDAKRIQRHSKVKRAVPISLGDSYKRFRIVGTKPAYLSIYDSEMAEGAAWESSMQAVIGAHVADETGLAIGDTFVGNHGLVGDGHAHDSHPYEVVGILKPTGRVIDRLVVTSLESVWDVHSHHNHDHKHAHKEHKDDKHDHKGHDHDHHNHGHKHHDHKHDDHKHDHHDHEADNREVTALLVTYRTRTAALSFPREINRKTRMQVASPAFEITRLVQLIGVGSDTLMSIGMVIIGIALAGVLIALFNAVRERRYDLALFRTFGASRRSIVSLIVIEGMSVALIGSLLGIALSYGGLFALGALTSKGAELGLGQFVILPELLILWVAVLFISLIACLIPAWQVYRLKIRDMLIHGQS